MLFFGGFLFLFLGKRTHDFAFVSLCYGRSGEEICTGYAMATSGRMQYDYKQTNTCGTGDARNFGSMKMRLCWGSGG